MAAITAEDKLIDKFKAFADLLGSDNVSKDNKAFVIGKLLPLTSDSHYRLMMRTTGCLLAILHEVTNDKNDEDIKIRSAALLARMCSNSSSLAQGKRNSYRSSENQAECRREGVHPFIANFLSSESREMQCAGLAFLQDFCFQNSTNQQVVTKSGLLVPIVILLGSSHLQVRLFACNTISTFSRSGPLEALMRATPVPALSHMLASPLPQERAATCRAIMTLGREPSNGLELSEQGVGAKLLKLALEATALSQLQRLGFKTLALLIEDPIPLEKDDGQVASGEEEGDGGESEMKVIDTGEVEITKRARTVVRTLIEEGVLEAILTTFERSPVDPGLLKVTLVLSRKIVESIGDEIVKRKAFDLDKFLLGVSRGLMQSSSDGVRIDAMTILSHFTSKKIYVESLSRTNLVWFVSSFLISFNAPLRYHAAKLLLAFTRVGGDLGDQLAGTSTLQHLSDTLVEHPLLNVGEADRKTVEVEVMKLSAAMKSYSRESKKREIFPPLLNPDDAQDSTYAITPLLLQENTRRIAFMYLEVIATSGEEGRQFVENSKCLSMLLRLYRTQETRGAMTRDAADLLDMISRMCSSLCADPITQAQSNKLYSVLAASSGQEFCAKCSAVESLLPFIEAELNDLKPEADNFQANSLLCSALSAIANQIWRFPPTHQILLDLKIFSLVLLKLADVASWISQTGKEKVKKPKDPPAKKKKKKKGPKKIKPNRMLLVPLLERLCGFVVALTLDDDNTLRKIALQSNVFPLLAKLALSADVPDPTKIAVMLALTTMCAQIQKKLHFEFSANTIGLLVCREAQSELSEFVQDAIRSLEKFSKMSNQMVLITLQLITAICLSHDQNIRLVVAAGIVPICRTLLSRQNTEVQILSARLIGVLCKSENRWSVISRRTGLEPLKDIPKDSVVEPVSLPRFSSKIVTTEDVKAVGELCVSSDPQTQENVLSTLSQIAAYHSKGTQLCLRRLSIEAAFQNLKSPFPEVRTETSLYLASLCSYGQGESLAKDIVIGGGLTLLLQIAQGDPTPSCAAGAMDVIGSILHWSGSRELIGKKALEIIANVIPPFIRGIVDPIIKASAMWCLAQFPIDFIISLNLTREICQLCSGDGKASAEVMMTRAAVAVLEVICRDIGGRRAVLACTDFVANVANTVMSADTFTSVFGCRALALMCVDPTCDHDFRFKSIKMFLDRMKNGSEDACIAAMQSLVLSSATTQGLHDIDSLNALPLLCRNIAAPELRERFSVMFRVRAVESIVLAHFVTVAPKMVATHAESTFSPLIALLVTEWPQVVTSAAIALGRFSLIGRNADILVKLGFVVKCITSISRADPSLPFVLASLASVCSKSSSARQLSSSSPKLASLLTALISTHRDDTVVISAAQCAAAILMEEKYALLKEWDSFSVSLVNRLARTSSPSNVLLECAKTLATVLKHLSGNQRVAARGAGASLVIMRLLVLCFARKDLESENLGQSCLEILGFLCTTTAEAEHLIGLGFSKRLEAMLTDSKGTLVRQGVEALCSLLDLGQEMFIIISAGESPSILASMISEDAVALQEAACKGLIALGTSLGSVVAGKCEVGEMSMKLGRSCRVLKDRWSEAGLYGNVTAALTVPKQSVQLAAARAVSILAQDPEICFEFGRAGIFPCLLAMLANNSDLELRRSAGVALNILLRDHNNKLLARDSGLLFFLKTLVGPSSSLEQREIRIVSVAIAISGYCGNSISVNDQYRHNIFDADLLQPIISETVERYSLLGLPTLRALTGCLRALSRLMVTRPTTIVIFTSSIPSLLKIVKLFLEKGDTDGAIDFLNALESMLQNQGSSWQLGRTAIDSDVMQVAFESISHESPRVKAAGSSLLHSLLKQRPLFQDCQRVALEHGILPHLLSCLDDSMPVSTRGSAAEAISLLVRNSAPSQRECRTALKLLESLLRTAHPRTAAEAAAMAIASICESDENHDEAVHAGVVAPLIDLVYSPDWRRQRAASFALASVSGRGMHLRNCAIIADTGGIIAFVVASKIAQTPEGRLSSPYLVATLGFLSVNEGLRETAIKLGAVRNIIAYIELGQEALLEAVHTLAILARSDSCRNELRATQTVSHLVSLLRVAENDKSTSRKIGLAGNGSKLRRELFLCLAGVCSDGINAAAALRSNVVSLAATALSIETHDRQIVFGALTLMRQAAEAEAQKAANVDSVRSVSYIGPLLALASDVRKEMSLVRRTALGVLDSFMRTSDMVLATISAAGTNIFLTAVRAGRDCETILHGMLCIQRLSVWEPGVHSLLQYEALRDILILCDPAVLPQNPRQDRTSTNYSETEPEKQIIVIQRVVAETLATLSQSVLIQDKLVSMGSLNYCLPLLLSGDPQCETLGCQLVTLWTFPESNKRIAVQDAKLLPVLASKLVLEETDISTVIASCSAIKSLASLPENKKAMVELSIIPALVRLLHCRNELVQTPAIGALRLLSSDSSSLRDLSMYGVERPLVSLLASKKETVRAAAVTTVGKLASNTANKKRLAQYGVGAALGEISVGGEKTQYLSDAARKTMKKLGVSMPINSPAPDQKQIDVSTTFPPIQAPSKKQNAASVKYLAERRM